MAMTEDPYEASLLQPMPAWPVAEACNQILDQMTTNTTAWNRMVALRKAAEVYYNYKGSLKCN